MVKKAVEEHKRSPLLPIFGLLLAVGLLGVAFAITKGILLVPGNVVGNSVLKVVGTNPPTTYVIAFTVGIWLALLAISYFLVAVLVGKDPNDRDAIPLPPKQKDLKRIKRR